MKDNNKTDWKATIEADMAQSDYHQRLVDGKLTKEEAESFEKTKKLFNEDVSHYLK
jgi:hypothetical protein